MKTIEKMVEHINEELEGAKEYAEKYIDSKARGNMARATKYKEMASDELRHASYIRDFAVEDIDGIKKVYQLDVDTDDMWHHANKKFVECMAIIRQMIAM